MRWVFVAALLLASMASAQVCLPELDAALAVSDDPAVVTGLDAARGLAAAVRLVEPAMPALVVVDPEGVPLRDLAPGDPAAADVRFLAERRLLPWEWTPDALSPAAWREMLRRFLGWYGLALEDLHEPPVDDRSLSLALAHTLDRVAAVVRPAALIVPADPTAGEPGFRGLVWNWTVAPRLVVFPPAPPGTSRDAAIAELETCALRIRDWFSAPGSVARALFADVGRRARMVVLATDPPSAGPWWVAAGDELDVLTYDHPRVQDAEAFAVLFDGPFVGLANLARLLPRVRTNVSPLGLARYLQSPP